MSDRVLPPLTLDKEVVKNPLRFKCTLEGWSVSGFSTYSGKGKDDGYVVATIKKGDIYFSALVGDKLLKQLRESAGQLAYNHIILEMVWMRSPIDLKQKYESWIPYLVSTT